MVVRRVVVDLVILATWCVIIAIRKVILPVIVILSPVVSSQVEIVCSLVQTQLYLIVVVLPCRMVSSLVKVRLLLKVRVRQKTDWLAAVGIVAFTQCVIRSFWKS